ncbi:hypothetical protein LCGC14_2305000, partial [marine sediment metagenome]
CEVTGFDKALLVVTGSEANDAVIQMMQRKRPDRKVLGIRGAYYGSTVGVRALQCGAIDETTLPSGFNPDYIGGVFLQAFRGRDADFFPHDWVRAWVLWAQAHDIPVGFDEMQSGMGRTGKWFGFQHFDIEPDFICLGKALGGGLPISAVVGKKELLELSDDLWSTHTGNPVCCAAALASIEVLEEEKLVERAATVGKLFGEMLVSTFPQYKVMGKGMIWGLDFKDKNYVSIVVEKCAKRGLLLVSTHSGIIKIGPPLTIPQGVLFEGLTILRDVINET